MKEVVVIMTIVCSGHLAVNGLPELVDKIALAKSDQPDHVIDPRFQGFDSDRPITKRDLIRYNKIYGLEVGSKTGSSILEAQKLAPPTGEHYSHPSSLISITSNPSDRRASPALF